MYPADYVICNVDITTAYNRLLDNLPHRRQQVAALEPSLSGMVFLWGKRGITPELRHHNILFSGDYREEFRQLSQERRPPEDPTVYVAISSKTDPGHAPAGYENWFVMVNMPPMDHREDGTSRVTEVRERVLGKLTGHGLHLAGAIESETIITPGDFSRSYGSHLGSIYGISSNSRQAAFRRHPNRSQDIRGLYFAGGSVHPGGGIPLVLLSGRIAAGLIAEREGVGNHKTNGNASVTSLRQLSELWTNSSRSTFI